jgi:RND family efflux transporter MFP subunit
MKRVFHLFAALAAVLLVATASVYGIRAWRARTGAPQNPPAMSPSMPNPPNTPAAGTTAPPATTARGEVTIDLRRQQLIGVRVVPVRRAAIDRMVRAVGVVRYDETRQAEVNVKVEGWIRDLYVDYTGQPIRAGQPLFTLYSPELLTTENEYLLALKTRDQIQHSIIPDAKERAEALVASARQRLLLWDLAAEQIATLETTHLASEALVFRAPVSGVVIEKQAIKGLHVMPGQSLYKVIDLATVWVEADVYENELADLRTGAPATITVNAYPGERFTGRAIYIYPYLDEKTRTNKVRFAFANRGGRLKPGMFANVELKAHGGSGLLVPTDAVLDSGTEQVVFVAHGDGRFEPRTVKVGRRLTDAIEILDGVKDNEQVATGATFFLDSESQLRASLQAYEVPPVQTAGSSASPAHLDISLRTVPDPPNAGSENQFEVVVKDASGKSIDDADVSVQLFMAAMPTMNMPAMRNEVKLSPAGGGIYRGRGHVLMAGRWDATVTVTRGGQRLGTKQLPVVAR